MHLSATLQSLRQQHGYSQEELAQRLHVARQTIGKWETGQSLPDLENIFAICQLYSLPLDYLLRSDDCVSAQGPTAPAEPLISFLLQAKRSTYAAHGPEAAPLRPGSHDFVFEQEIWRYQDSYLGGNNFIGQEIVWHDQVPVWGMNYSGQVIDTPFSGDFLKNALMHVQATMPYRGPQLLQNGSWTYHCQADGMVEWFSGREDIYFENKHVYVCQFHGGKLG